MNTKIRTRFGLATAATLVLSLAVNAATWYVSPSGDDSVNDGTTVDTPFATPAKAVTKVANGDTIILGKGTYLMTANLGMGNKSDLTLTGETENPRDVVLDFQGAYRGITANNADGIVISHLTVTNGFGAATDTDKWAGSGIHLGSLTTPTASGKIKVVTNCVITCCKHLAGNAGSSLRMDITSRVVDSQILNNTNTTGAVVMYGGELVGCTVDGTVGPGVAAKIESNAATSTVVRACTVRNTEGHGLFNILTVRDCLIEDNRAVGTSSNPSGDADSRGGGLFYLMNPDVMCYLPTDARFVVSNSIIRGNYAKVAGGGLAVGPCYAIATNLLVDSCQFISNSVYQSDGQYGGGAIGMCLNTVKKGVEIRNSLFEGNIQLAQTKSDGSAKSVGGAAIHIIAGAANVVPDEMIRIENCTFVGNRNESGSDNSITLTFSSWPRIAVLTNCVFASNLKVWDGVTNETAGVSTHTDAYNYCYLWPNSSTKYNDTVINDASKPPKFQEGTWIPTARSPMRDAGVTLPWMTGAKDLQRDESGKAFRDRLIGSAPDMGCYEYMSLGLLFIVR